MLMELLLIEKNLLILVQNQILDQQIMYFNFYKNLFIIL